MTSDHDHEDPAPPAEPASAGDTNEVDDPHGDVEFDDDELLDEAINAQPDRADDVRALQDHVAWLTERVDELESTEQSHRHGPAPWAIYTPPAAAGTPPHEDEGPGFTVSNFVAWYNLTYVGLPSTRARPIPPCWPHHPGLASEIATLAYSWLDAFTGNTATPHKAQLWHHHDRPGFAERLTHEWTHPHCHDHAHKPAGAPSRHNRNELTSDAKPGNHAPESLAPE